MYTYNTMDPVQLSLLIFLNIIYYKLQGLCRSLATAFQSRHDAIGFWLARIAFGIVTLSLLIIFFTTIDGILNFGYKSFSTLFLNLFIWVLILLCFSFIPHLVLKLQSAIHNKHSTGFALFSVAQTAIALYLIYWLGGNFNKGMIAFRAIQLISMLIVVDALYELWFLFTRKNPRYTIVGIIAICLYAISLIYMPIDRLFTFSWSYVQGIPYHLGLFFLTSRGVLNVCTGIALFLTSGVRQNVRAR